MLVDKPVLFMEMPKLDTDTAVEVYEFLCSLASSFEAHYYKQIKEYFDDRYHFDDEIPF